MLQIDHYTFHVEWWPTDEPVSSFTVHYADGTCVVVPAIALGPFDNLAEVMREASLKVDRQLPLW